MLHLTRWQVCKLLIQVLFSRDFKAVLRALVPMPTSEADPPPVAATPAVKPVRFEYDVITSRMVKRAVAGIVVLAIASTAYATGSFNVMDPITKLGKRITGGDGIDITAAGAINATGIPAGGVSDNTFKAYTSAGGGRATNDRVDTVQEQVTGQAVGSALGATAVQPEQFNNFSTAQGIKDAAQDAAFANHTSALGSAAYEPVTSFATAAQGDLAGTALQSGAPATSIANTPAGSVAATTVQGAIDELGSEKLAATGDGSQLTGITAGQVGAAVTGSGWQQPGAGTYRTPPNTTAIQVQNTNIGTAYSGRQLTWESTWKPLANESWHYYNNYTFPAIGLDAASRSGKTAAQLWSTSQDVLAIIGTTDTSNANSHAIMNYLYAKIPAGVGDGGGGNVDGAGVPQDPDYQEIALMNGNSICLSPGHLCQGQEVWVQDNEGGSAGVPSRLTGDMRVVYKKAADNSYIAEAYHALSHSDGQQTTYAPDFAYRVSGTWKTGLNTADATFTGDAVRVKSTDTFGDGTNSYTLAQLAAGGGTWGSIAGTLADQTDLQVALAAKAPLSGAVFTSAFTVESSSSAGGTLKQANASGAGPSFSGLKARGDIGSPTGLLAGDLLISLGGGGHNTSAYVFNKAMISLASPADWTTTSNPTMVTFATTPVGGTSRAEHMRIDSTGNVGIGTTSPTEKLHVAGTTKSTQFQDTPYAPAAGTTFTVNLDNGMDQELTTNGNVTITLPTPVAGKSYTVTVKYGGAHTVTWAGGGTIKWSNGTAPTATSVSGKYDIYVFKSDATSTYTMGADGGRNY